MASGLHKYTVVEAQNAALGQAGSIFVDGTTAISGKKIVAIQFIEDSTFTTLTPSSYEFIGTAGGSGNAIDTDNTFPQGMTIFGQWTAVTLTSGSSAVIYLGTF